MFPQKFGAKTDGLSAINTRFSWKKYLLPRKSRSSQRRCSLKEGMQRPAQVFSCEYCEIFKKTYSEKHLQTAAYENRASVTNLPKGSISWILSSFYLKLLVFKAFNFAMMECFFSLEHIFIIKRYTSSEMSFLHRWCY